MGQQYRRGVHPRHPCRTHTHTNLNKCIHTEGQAYIHEHTGRQAYTQNIQKGSDHYIQISKQTNTNTQPAGHTPRHTSDGQTHIYTAIHTYRKTNTIHTYRQAIRQIHQHIYTRMQSHIQTYTHRRRHTRIQTGRHPVR